MFKYLGENDSLKVREYMTELDDRTEVRKYVDKGKNSLFQIAAKKDSLECMKVIAELILDMNSKVKIPIDKRKEYLADMINVHSAASEGFNAMHLASFRGAIDMVRFLKEHGADIHMRSRNGSSMLHLATQGDQPRMMKYYLDEGIHIDTVNSQKHTSLHWATLFGCEVAQSFLLAWEANIECTDVNGQTPLHVGCKYMQQS